MAAPSLTPGQTLGHFRLIEEIGAGGFGIVYRAWDTRLERDVAVKVLNAKALADETASRRFRREALILSRLNHPNVESVFEFNSEQGVDYLVLEYVPGASLNERLEMGALLEKEVLALGIQLARGLAAAHAEGIIHRDLKPGNLRVRPDNVLKILDFGLAQLFAAPGARTLTETATATMETPSFAGTLSYMAPEQLEGREPDNRSDIYCAGVVLYELATGSRPFPQQGQMVWEAILHSLPPAPRIKNKDISPGLEAVILKCLGKDPDLRYQCASELLDDLERVRAGQDTTASTQGWGVARFGTTRKTRAVLVLAAVLLLGIGAGIVARKPPWQPPAQQKIMAVLPFDSVGQEAATTALGLGLTETLTAKLVAASNSDAIQVVAPRDLRDQGVKTADDARREFGTDFVLESTLQRQGRDIRVNIYLVDSRTHRQIAARTFTVDSKDSFGLQDRVVSEALDMLPTQIMPDQRQKLAVRQDTKPAAYEAYILGRGYLQELKKPEDLDNAIAAFTQALKIDPNYAPGYAALGEAYLDGFRQFGRGNDWIAKASSYCQEALLRDRDLAQGHVCLGKIFINTGNYNKAVGEFERAVKSDPESEDALLGFARAYTKLGNLAAAESTYKQAIALRPNYWRGYSWLGVFYFAQARYSDAAEMFRKVTELAPDNYLGYSNLGGAYVLLGRYADAINASQRSIALRPSSEAYANLGYTYFLMHRFGDAVTALEALKPPEREWQNWGNLADVLYWIPERRAEAAHAYQSAISLALARLEVNPHEADILAYLADYYAMTGDKQLAFSYLERALSAAPSDTEVLFRAGLVNYRFNRPDQALAFLKKAAENGYSRTVIRDTPDFQPLQQDGRFQEIIRNR